MSENIELEQEDTSTEGENDILVYKVEFELNGPRVVCVDSWQGIGDLMQVIYADDNWLIDWVDTEPIEYRITIEYMDEEKFKALEPFDV